jgi:hypothetical protein
MNTSVKVLKIALKILLIFLPGQSIYSRGCILPNLEECILKQTSADVVEECGELLLSAPASNSTYAGQLL